MLNGWHGVFRHIILELMPVDAVMDTKEFSPKQMKGGVQLLNKMEEIITIQGKLVIEIYESFDGSYWFITEKLYKQDSLINGKVYKDDQILFG
jgi:hypothetical protein